MAPCQELAEGSASAPELTGTLGSGSGCTSWGLAGLTHSPHGGLGTYGTISSSCPEVMGLAPAWPWPSGPALATLFVGLTLLQLREPQFLRGGCSPWSPGFLPA